MENNTETNKDAIIGFILLFVILVIGYFLISKIWSIFSSIDPKLGAGLVAASGTFIVTTVSILISKYLERRAVVLAHLREKKIPTYEKIISLIFTITFSDKIGKKPPTDKQLVKTMAEITQELVIWGSDEIIDAYHKFRMQSVEITVDDSESDPYDVLFQVEDLLLAIRKDLGHKNNNIPRGKILGLFINDLPDELKHLKTS